MTIKSPPSFLTAGSYTAQLDRLLTQTLAGTAGVNQNTAMKVSASGTPGMTVVVAAGGAFIAAGEGQQGFYYAYNDADLPLNITTANGTFPRIDAVICTVRDAESSGSSNDVRLLVVAGIAASSPTPPSLTAYPNSTVLAYVAVAANTLSITSGNITDKRTKAMIPTAGVSTLAAVTSPIEGQLAYQLSDHRLYVYDNTSTWQLVWPFTLGAITGSMIASNTILPSNMTTANPYPINISGNADTASTANAVAWTSVTGKPAIGNVFNDGGTYGISISGNATYSSLASAALTFYGRADIKSGLDIETTSQPGSEILSLYRNNDMVSGTASFTIRDASYPSPIVRMYVDYLGRVYGTGTYVNLSDETDKNTIQLADCDALASAIDGLIPKTFIYNADELDNVHVGFIAQDVQKVLPSAVTAFDNEKLGLDSSVIIAALVAKCQQLEERLSALEAK